MKPKDSQKLALGGGFIAAMLASLCCVGPLVLLLFGVSGAWIANLRLLEDYRYLFMGVSGVMLFWAYRGIYLQKEDACPEGQVCTRPKVKQSYKIAFWAIAIFTIILFLIPLLSPLFY